MLECRDIDGLMMDSLYQELARDQKGDFDAHLDGCARCQGELAMFQRTREAVAAMPEVEPPSSISAILLHEAAKASPAPARAAAPLDDDDEPAGILGWFSRLLNPIVLHPAATAMATLVLVAGVAGSIYIRGDHRVTTHEAASVVAAPEPALEHRGGLMRMPDDTASRAAGEAGYAADIAPLEQEVGRWDDGAKGNGAPEPEGKLAETTQRVSRGGERAVVAPPKTGKNKSAPTVANAVSGTDVLVDLDDAPGDGLELAKKKPAVVTPSAPPPPPAQDPSPSTAPGNYRVYKEEEKASDKTVADKRKSETVWAAGKQQQLEEAAKLKRCQDAARIANDILDRNPDYYYQRVDRSSSVKTCSGFVSAERDRRAQSRGKKRAAKPKKSTSKKGASSSDKAQAAPARDEAASED